MHANIACTFSNNFDDLQTALIEALLNALAVLFPGVDLAIAATVHLDSGPEIESGRRAEELLKVFWMCGLREKGEDAPSIVIDQNNSQIEFM